MKICPFLVAGQESVPPLRGGVSPRDAARFGPRAEEARDPEQATAVEPMGTAATGLWALEDDEDAARRSLECLGEPCRFFHAGGCRFDSLFAAGGQAAGSFLVQESDPDAPSLPSILQEVWSLQRESLKEMIGGFRRLEGAQGQSDVAGMIDGLSARLDEVRKSDELAAQLDQRFETLQGSVTALKASLEAAFGGSAADLGGQIDGLRREVQKNQAELEGARSDVAAARAGVEKTQGEMEQARAAIETTRAALETTRTGVEHTQAAAERTLGEVERARAAAETTRAEVQNARTELEATRTATSGLVQEKFEALVQALQKQLTTLRRDLSKNAGATQAGVQELLTQSAASARAELEQTLQRVLENSRNMQVLREEMRGSLQQLADQVREIAASASALATAAQHTEDIVAEQRTYSESVLQRERHDAARRLNNAGVLAFHEGAYDTSVAKFREALEHDPALAEAWNNLGLSYTEMQQDDQALEAYKKALELDPRVGQVYNNLGYLYHRRGELEQAVEMYERATVRAHDTSAAWSNLANALYALQRVDDAVGAWKRALELDPANDKASRALERLGLETSH